MNLPPLMRPRRYLRRARLVPGLRARSVDGPNGKIRFVEGFERIFNVVLDRERHIIVTDFLGDMLIKFTPDLQCVGWLGSVNDGGWKSPESTWLQTPLGQLEWPHAVDFNEAGNLLVTELNGRRIRILEPGGRLIGTIGPKLGGMEMKGPVSANLGADGCIYVTDFRGHAIFKLNGEGKFLGVLGARRQGGTTAGFEREADIVSSDIPGGLNNPHHARFANDGYIYVADTGNNRIQRFDGEGQWQGWIGVDSEGHSSPSWRSEGNSVESSNPGGFFNPVSLDFDDTGNLIIGENGNSRIQKFSRAGEFLGWFGGSASGANSGTWKKKGEPRASSDPGCFNHLFYATLSAGLLYVADHDNHRLQIVPLD